MIKRFVKYTLLVLLIPAVLGLLLFSPIAEEIRTPKVIINVTENRKVTLHKWLGLPIGEKSSYRILYQAGEINNYVHTIFTEDSELDDIFGTEVVYKYLDCEDCNEYSFVMKNLGNWTGRLSRPVESITLDWAAPNKSQIISASPGVEYSECKNSDIKRGCRVKTSLIEGSKEFLRVDTSNYTLEDGDIECSVNGFNNKCLIQFRHHYIYKDNPGLNETLEDKKGNILVELPKDVPAGTSLFLRPSDKKWVTPDKCGK